MGVASWIRAKWDQSLGQLSLLAKFSLLGFAITALITLALSWILQNQLVDRALQLEAQSAADQVSLILQDYLRPEDFSGPLSPERLDELDRLLKERILHAHIVRIKLWSPSGVLIYSDNREQVGRQFPLSEGLRRALKGEVAMSVSPLEEPENIGERDHHERLMEIYVPVYLPGEPGVVGVYEIYHDLGVIQPVIQEMRRFVWGSVMLGFLVLYMSLFGLVRRASLELRRQSEENARLAAETEQANIELRQALQFQEEIIQNVSHELRTPLALIQGFAEVLHDRLLGELSDDQADAVESIRTNTVRLRRMVDLLLDVQRAAGRSIEKERIDLAELVEKIAAAWGPRLEKQGFTLKLEIESRPLYVMGDSADLWRVLDNLLDNACKFSPRDSTITIRVWREDSEALVAVQDEGIGISQDQLARVFERFYQVSSGMSRRYGGLGLGLTLCKQIITAHGGRIWAESPGEGKGSTFTFALPLVS